MHAGLNVQESSGQPPVFLFGILPRIHLARPVFDQAVEVFDAVRGFERGPQLLEGKTSAVCNWRIG